MARHFYVRQSRQGEQPPVCTHCRGTDLKKNGHYGEKQRYFCRTCQRHSYGLPPDLRPKCYHCRAVVTATLLADGRYQYRCTACRKSFRSEYITAPREVSKVPLRHHFSFWLDRHSRQRLVDYAQAKRCPEVRIVRAIFRPVLPVLLPGPSRFFFLSCADGANVPLDLVTCGAVIEISETC